MQVMIREVFLGGGEEKLTVVKGHFFIPYAYQTLNIILT